MKRNALVITVLLTTMNLTLYAVPSEFEILTPEGWVTYERPHYLNDRYNDSSQAKTTTEEAFDILKRQGVDISHPFIQHQVGGYGARAFAEAIASGSANPNYNFSRAMLVYIRDYGFPNNFNEMQRQIESLDAENERRRIETRNRERAEVERGLEKYQAELLKESENAHREKQRELKKYSLLTAEQQTLEFEKLQNQINKLKEIQSADLKELFELKEKLSKSEDREIKNLAFGKDAANARALHTFQQKLFSDTNYKSYDDLSKLQVINLDGFLELDVKDQFEYLSDLKNHLKSANNQFSTTASGKRSNIFQSALQILKEGFVVQAFAKGYYEQGSKELSFKRPYYYSVPSAEKSSIEVSIKDKNLFLSRYYIRNLFSRIKGYANKDSILQAELGTYAANKILTAASSNYRYVIEGGVAKKITQKEVERRLEQAERIAEIDKRNQQIVYEEKIRAEKEQSAFERRGLPTRLAEYNTLKESLQRIETKFNTEMTYLFELVNNLSNFKSRSEANGNARFDLFRSINYAIGMSYYDNANSPEDFIKLLLRANGVVSNLFDFSKLKVFTDNDFDKLTISQQENAHRQLSEKIKTMEAILGADQNRSELLSKILDRLQKHMTVIKYISGYFKQIPSNSYLPSAREVVNELSDPRLNEIFSRYLEHFDARFTPFKDNIANVDKAYSIIKDTMGNNTRGMTKLQLDAQKKAKESALKETQEILGAVSPKNGKVNSLDSVKSGGFDIKSLSPTELAKACKALF